MSTMVNISPTPIQRFVDSNGNALAGGLLFTYQAGTTTKYPTYTDSTGNTPNTNPIVLNQRGEASIWLVPTQSYKFVLAPANDTDPPQSPIWTEDHIQANAAVAVGNMTDELGSDGNPGFKTGTDFTPNVTTSLTLANEYGSASNLWVAFDAAEQGADSFSLSGKTLTFNAPIPSGVTKVFVKGGTALTIGTPGDGTVTDSSVSSSAGINASKLSFLQQGSGAVKRTVLAKLREAFSVTDFGATGDGTTDDTAAVQAAENAAATAGKSLRFPAGTYLINNTGLTKSSGVSWFGDGSHASVIKGAAGTFNTSLVSGGAIADVVIENLGFDFSASAFATFMRNVYFTTFTDSAIRFCDFKQQAIGFQCDGGTDFAVEDCTFEQSTSYGTTINEGVWVTKNTSRPSRYSVCRNQFVNVGTDFDGDHAFIDSNYMTGWGYGAGITTEQGTFNHTITNNQCLNGTGIDANSVTPFGIEMWSNQSIVKGNLCMNNAGAGISVGGANSVVSGNICLNNGVFTAAGAVTRYRTGIIIRYVSPSINGSTSIVSDNLCGDTGGGTQLYGLTDDSSSVGGVTVADNLLIGATAPTLLLGNRYDFKGPKLTTSSARSGFTIGAGSSTGAFSTAVSGVQLGDKVSVSLSVNPQGVIAYGYVDSTSSVTVNFYNPTAGSITLANFTANISIEKPFGYSNY